MAHIQRIKVLDGIAVNLWSDKPTEIVLGLFLSTLRTKDNERLCRELNIVARVAIYREGDPIPWSPPTRSGSTGVVGQTEESSSKLLCIPVYDQRSTNLLEHFPSICHFINKHADVPSSLDELASKLGAADAKAGATKDAVNGGDGSQESKRPRAVLVHCVMGISRSATAVAAFLMHQYGMSRDQALGHIAKRRPQINPNGAFQKQLLDWHDKMRRVREFGKPKPAVQVLERWKRALPFFEKDFEADSEHPFRDNVEHEGVFPFEL
ncbi:hypothetical protein GGTG_05559 [Gaeumannomyces tritici R3-111a-1]|uniref:protein-tyrosine-phosphatase n=1 Tax=Gaeumannomyces tritici (strain R3-111a-1) TaxID=644352 RepID=J3NW94_GAET3|nr:hypothetical protein GGTG_05559 [Gaeumannomyces tritici R3-111a-1]EJT75626.1 hypothetical protein GGTG_05559 [Gaeumannomyces tritici R3-111a-1]